MDTSHSYQGYYLKIWADKYSFPVEIKNGADFIRPKVIIVTSNYKIEEVFPDPSIHKPLLRRFKVIHKDQPWDKNPFTIAADTNVLAEDTWEPKAKKVFKTKQINKKRKFDQPLKVKKPLKQVNGKIVPNKETQTVVKDHFDSIVQEQKDNLPLTQTQEIAKEKEVIELMDSEEECDAMEIIETMKCTECGLSIINCICYEDSDIDYNENELINVIDSFSDSESDDLFDV